ncbi:hypothetical protein MBLNU457_6037t1 [Dothideomycetes sp. NU457]
MASLHQQGAHPAHAADLLRQAITHKNTNSAVHLELEALPGLQRYPRITEREQQQHNAIIMQQDPSKLKQKSVSATMQPLSNTTTLASSRNSTANDYHMQFEV